MQRNIVLSTCRSKKEAARLARDIVNRRLAACVNIIAISSIYRWKGRIVTGHEYLLIIKTSSKAFEKLRQRIIVLHSYEVPELLSLRIANGHKPYLEWLDAQVKMD